MLVAGKSRVAPQSSAAVSSSQHVGIPTQHERQSPSPIPAAPLGSLVPDVKSSALASGSPRPLNGDGVKALLIKEKALANAQAQPRTGTLEVPSVSTWTERMAGVEFTPADILPADFVAKVEAFTGSPMVVIKNPFELDLDKDGNKQAHGTEYVFQSAMVRNGNFVESAKIATFCLAASNDFPGVVWIEGLRLVNPLNQSQALGQDQYAKGFPFKIFKDASQRVLQKVKEHGAQQVQVTGAQDLIVHHLYRKLMGFKPLTARVALKEAVLDQIYQTSHRDFPPTHRCTSMEHFSWRLGTFRGNEFSPELLKAFEQFKREQRVDQPALVMTDADGKPVALWSGTMERRDSDTQQYLFLNPLDPNQPLTWSSLEEAGGFMSLKRDLNASNQS